MADQHCKDRPFVARKSSTREEEPRGHAEVVGGGAQDLEHSRGRPRPLIDQVTNSWRDKEVSVTAQEIAGDETGICDFEDEGSCPNLTYSALKSRRFRRMFALILLFGVVLLYSWKWYLRPSLVENWEYEEGFVAAKSNGTYGFSRGGDFEGTWIEDLNPALLPGGPADPTGQRRLIFVGDIHGCTEELTHLLQKVNFDKHTDHLIATGDTVSKGPDNKGVLEKLLHLDAQSVRGNHEDRLLTAAKDLLGTDTDPESPVATSKGYHKDHKILESLKHRHIQYLRDMPLMLRVPALPQAPKSKARDFIVVHAGLVPFVPLERQDPFFVMNMRSIDQKTHVPSEVRETKKGNPKPWYKVWNWYMSKLCVGKSTKGYHVYSYADWVEEKMSQSWLGVFKSKRKQSVKPHVVVYGHDSKSGLQTHPWSKGLDSGCVGGGELTAMVLDAKGTMSFVHVNCKNYR